MPWNRNEQARKHTRKANSPKRQRQWRHVANSALRRGQSEGSAVRQANAVVSRGGRKTAKRRTKGRASARRRSR
jgi:hypothetical protein